MFCTPSPMVKIWSPVPSQSLFVRIIIIIIIIHNNSNIHFWQSAERKTGLYQPYFKRRYHRENCFKSKQLKYIQVIVIRNKMGHVKTLWSTDDFFLV